MAKNSYMKIICLVLLIFQLNSSNAGDNSSFSISPANPEVGQNIIANISSGYSWCNPLVLNQDGTLKRNFILEGSRVKLLTYFEYIYSCVPILPPLNYNYQLLDLGLPAGDYILELYTLSNDVPFPLPQNFDLVLQTEILFQMRAPIIIDSSSKLSLSILILLFLSIGFIAINRQISALKN